MKYKLFLFTVLAAVWLWAAYQPLHPHDWLLENYLVFIWVPIIVAVGYYFRLSNVSYTLITLYLCMHLMGSHYSYSEVPLGYYFQHILNSDRNMYDRIVHFSFGLLLAYPVREVYIRLGRTRGIWSYFLPIEMVFGFSAIYEIIEWRAAANVPAELGLQFLGSQGDVWDAQKDMLMAGVGSIIAMLLVLVIHISLNPRFWKEMKDSVRVRKDDQPLGEEKIASWLSRS